MRNALKMEGEGMNILLICSSGMSTSLIVSRMRKAARDQEKEYKITAVGVDSAYEYYDDTDVILIGPQISSYIKTIQEESGLPTAIIDRANYGSCRGEEILKEAEALLV